MAINKYSLFTMMMMMILEFCFLFPTYLFTSIITFYDSNLIIKSGERERAKKMSNNIMFVFVCFVFWNKWVKFNWNLVNALCVCVSFFTCFSSLFNISLSCWINKLKQIKKNWSGYEKNNPSIHPLHDIYTFALYLFFILNVCVCMFVQWNEII